MKLFILSWLAYVFTWPELLLRVPAAIVLGIIAWTLWLWLYHIAWPWARVVIKVLCRFFELFEIIPRKSKEWAEIVEKKFGLEHGPLL